MVQRANASPSTASVVSGCAGTDYPAPRAGYRATAADSDGAGPAPEKAGRMMTHRHEPVMAAQAGLPGDI